MALIKRRGMKKTKIEIIPMIDTMFFLLVFFILASLNVIDVKGAIVDLPDSKNQDKQVPAKLTVTIKSNGEISVNKTATVGPDDDVGEVLMTTLANAAAGGGSFNAEETVVVINADKAAEYRVVRRVVDEARQKQFKKFSIATDPKFFSAE